MSAIKITKPTLRTLTGCPALVSISYPQRWSGATRNWQPGAGRSLNPDQRRADGQKDETKNSKKSLKFRTAGDN